MNRKNIFISTFTLLVIFILCVFYFGQKEGKTEVPAKDVFALAILMDKVPHTSKLYQHYTETIDSQNGELTNVQYDHFKKAVSQIYESHGAESDKVNSMSELDIAKDNLRAFDDVGYMVVPESKIPEVREKLVEKIKMLEK